MQKQIRKSQAQRRQKELAVVMALVNGLNMVSPVAMSVAAELAPLKHGEPVRRMAAVDRGVRVLDSLFFSTAYAEIIIDSDYKGTGKEVNTDDSESYIIQSGGTQNVINGGIVTSAAVHNRSRQNVSNGGSTSGTMVNSGGAQNVSNGGSTSGTMVNSGGAQNVSSGGSTSGTMVNSGGAQYVYSGGSTSGTTVNRGGAQYVYSGGSTSDTIVSGYKSLQGVYNGGSTIGTTVHDFGTQNVSKGGSTSGTMLNSGGMQNVYNGGSTIGTILSGSQSIEYVSVSGRTTSSIKYQRGVQNVSSGGSASGTTVNSNGWLNVSIGGTATAAIVNSGGILYLDGGASAKDITLREGYVLKANTNATLTPEERLGGPSIINRTATSITLNSGGSLRVYGGGTAISTRVNNTCYLDIADGSASDTTVEEGGFISLLDPSATLSGDTILDGGMLRFYIGNYTAGGNLIAKGGFINLAGYDPRRLDTSLTIENLSGSATFIINTDLAKAKASHISINNITSGSGEHNLQVNFDPFYEAAEDDLAAARNGIKGKAALFSDASAVNFTAVGTDYGAYRFIPTLLKEEGSWYVTGFKLDGSEPSTIAYNAAGAAASNITLWRQENSSLIRRMGELRNGGHGGDWARIYKGELETDSFGRRVKHQYTAIQGGHDTLVNYNGRDWYAGYTVSYLDADVNMERGGGDAGSLTVGGYAAWLGDKGHYLDLILKVGRLKNDFHSYQDDGSNTRIGGGYHNWGTSLSAEYGYRKPLQNDWYVEPQAELTLGRVGSASYTLSDNTRVHQDSMTSVVGRLGAAVGRTVGRSHVYAKASLLREFNATARTDVGGNVLREELKDNWLEVALGITGEFNDRVNGYLELSRTTGGDKTKTPWQVNVGARWKF